MCFNCLFVVLVNIKECCIFCIIMFIFDGFVFVLRRVTCLSWLCSRVFFFVGFSSRF